VCTFFSCWQYIAVTPIGKLSSILKKCDFVVYKECVGLTSACCAGTLNLEVPEFVDLVQSEEDKTATLSVRDPNAKEQKEMWGTS
jgi:hypothetical protein